MIPVLALATMINDDAVSWVTAVRVLHRIERKLAVERGAQRQRTDGLQNVR